MSTTYAGLGLIYVRDGSGVVHLADESPLGGVVSGCNLVGDVVVVEPVPDHEVCEQCRGDNEGFFQ